MLKKNTLLEFVLCFDRALAKQRQKEAKSDHKTIDGNPKLKTDWCIEQQMSEIYTRNIF